MNPLSTFFSYLRLSCTRTNAIDNHPTTLQNILPRSPLPSPTTVTTTPPQQTVSHVILHSKTTSIFPQQVEGTLKIARKNKNSIQKQFCKCTYSDGVNVEGIIETGTFVNGELWEGTRTNELLKTTEKGFFKNGLLIQGSITNLAGTTCTGTFDNDREITGYGRIEFPNGGKYIGEFKKGSLNGLGWVVYSDGKQEIGDFSILTLHGRGVIIDRDEIIKSGYYEMGSLKEEYWIDLENLKGQIFLEEKKYLDEFWEQNGLL